MVTIILGPWNSNYYSAAPGIVTITCGPWNGNYYSAAPGMYNVQLFMKAMTSMNTHRLLYKWTEHGKSPSITTDPNTLQN